MGVRTIFLSLLMRESLL